MIIFKKLVDNNRFFCMHPLLLVVATEMHLYCHKHDIPFVITSTVSTLKEDKKLKRVSNSHRTCRAFDLRSWVFTETQREDFVKHFNRKFKNIAAVTRDGTPQLVVYHIGTAPHFHIQIHSKYSTQSLLDM